MDGILSEDARRLLEARYLLRDEQGVVVETVDGLFDRVAAAVAETERAYPRAPDVAATEQAFRDLLADLRFLPNTPTLINAGTELGQLMACFVLPVPDSLHGIFTALHDAAIIQQSGGGTGFSFAHLRPRGDIVRSTRRPSSGPVPFIGLFDAMSDVIAGESVRGGANMGVLRFDHPDVREFITAKREPGRLTHFNLSVALTDAFFIALDAGRRIALVNPRSGETAGSTSARALFDLMAESAWETGDPGLLFLDRIERDNPTPTLGTLKSTNPCGEVPLLPYEACCLGSINLPRILRHDGGRPTIDERSLAETVALAVRFLDDVIDASRYPLPEIEAICRANRKIGLGVMGLADLLLEMEIAYGSPQSLALIDHLMTVIEDAAVRETRALADERGAFPNFAISRYAAAGEPPRRNATVTTVAPTGSISLIAGCSSGIEPLYALAYRHEGRFAQVVEPHPALVAALERAGLATPEMLQEIEETGRIGHMTTLPDDLRGRFRVASEIPVAEHLAVQAVVQRHVENAVSKTINLPAEATVDDVRSAYSEAHRLGCKGVTIYRDGSRAGQVLQVLGRCLACTGEDRLPRTSVA